MYLSIFYIKTENKPIRFIHSAQLCHSPLNNISEMPAGLSFSFFSLLYK